MAALRPETQNLLVALQSTVTELEVALAIDHAYLNQRVEKVPVLIKIVDEKSKHVDLIDANAA